MSQNDSELKIREIPIFLWLFGAVFTAVGILILLENTSASFMGGVFAAIGLALILLPSVLTISGDRTTRTLKLDYRSALRRKTKQFMFDEIAAVNVERSVSHRKGRTQYTYRVSLSLKDGKSVPVRAYSSTGSGRKVRQADQLREFIGVSGYNFTPTPLPPAFHVAGIQKTDGVSWLIKPSANSGIQWHSPDFKTQGIFLFLAQKAAGQASGGFLASLGSMFFRQTIGAYGFDAEDVPGIEQAGPLAPLDPLLEPHFMAYSNAPSSASQLLNSTVASALADWAGRYPIRQFQKSSSFGQLVLLIGPTGVFLATMNALKPDQISELTALGIKIVKAQPHIAQASAS